MAELPLDFLGTPKAPMPSAPPKMPTYSQAKATQSQGDLLRKRRGRGATILTGPTGTAATPQGLAVKTLLGQ